MNKIWDQKAENHNFYGHNYNLVRELLFEMIYDPSYNKVRTLLNYKWERNDSK